MANVTLSPAEESDLLDKLSREKAVELIPVSLYVMIMMAAGLCGNVLVCVFYNHTRRLTPTTRLIVAVAVIDTVICILMPKNVADISLSYKFKSSALCKLNNLVNHTTAIASAFVLIAVAAFRFRAVCKPFSSQFSLRHANIAVAIAVGVAFALSLPVLGTHESVAINVTVDSQRTLTGYDCNTSKRASLKGLNLFVNILHFFIFLGSTTVFVVLYGKMGFVIFKYYKRKRYLSDKTSSSVHSTSEMTSKSEVDSGCSVDEDDHDTKKIVAGHVLGTVSDIIGANAVDSATEMLEGIDGTVVRESDKDAECSDNSAPAVERSERDTTNIDHIDHADDDMNATDDKDMCSDKDKPRDTNHAMVTFDKECIEADHHNHNKKKQSDAEIAEERRLFEVAAKQTAMLFMITAIFFLSFLPYLGMNISRTLAKNKSGDDAFTNWIQFCTRSYLINSAANPFVYGLFNSEFRAFVKKTLCRCCFK